MGQAGSSNLGLIVVGYSLPSHDDYAKQALFKMFRNYQDVEWDTEWPDGQKKNSVLVVDRQEDQKGRKRFLSRFGFVDPSKATFHFSGFDEQALHLMQKTP